MQYGSYPLATPSAMKSSLIRGVASHEGNNLVVYYCLSATDNWSDKKGCI